MQLQPNVTANPDWDRHRQRMWRFTPGFRRWREAVGGAYLSALTSPGLDVPRMGLITTGRTGSELLVQLLNSHPDMTCDSEVLDYGPDWPRLFLRGRAAAAARQGAAAYGFKLTANQLKWPVLIRQPRLFFDDLDHAGVIFVRLRRRDLIRQAVSHERAKAIGRWHGESPDVAPRLSPADVIHTLVWLEQHDHLLDDVLAGRDVLELVYEDDLTTPEQQRATAMRLFDTLGLTSHQASAQLHRGSPGPTCHMVSNWDEISATIDTTRFRSLLSSAPKAETGRFVRDAQSHSAGRDFGMTAG